MGPLVVERALPRYGGTGAQHPRPDEVWVPPGHGALLLRPGAPSPNCRSELEKALGKAKELRGGSGGGSG